MRYKKFCFLLFLHVAASTAAWAQPGPSEMMKKGLAYSREANDSMQVFNLERAAQLNDSAYQAYQLAGFREGWLFALSFKATLLNYQLDFVGMMAQVEALLDSAELRPMPPELSAPLYFQKGVYLQENRNYIESLAAFELSIDELKRVTQPFMIWSWGEPDEQKKADMVRGEGLAALGYIYNYMHFPYLYLSDTDQALEYEMKALRIFEELGMQSDLLNAYENVRIIHLQADDRSNALRLARLSLDSLLAWQSSIPEPERTTRLGVAYGSLGILQAAAGNPEGFELADKGIHLLGLPRPYSFFAPITGATEEEERNHFIAHKAFYRALGENKALARQELEQAVSGIFINSINFELRSTTLRIIGRTYSALGDLPAALAFYQKALATLHPIDSMDYRANPDLQHIVVKYRTLWVLQDKAAVLLEMAKKNSDGPQQKAELLWASLHTADLGIRLLDELRKGLFWNGFLQEKALLDKDRMFASLFEAGIESALALKTIAPQQAPALDSVAFDFSNKAKAFILRFAIRQVKNFKGIDPKERMEELGIKSSIDASEKKLAFHRQDMSPLEIKQEEDLRFEKRRELERRIKARSSDNPAARFFYETKTTTLAEVQRYLLNDSTAMVDYFETSTAIHAIAVKNSTHQVFSSPKPSNWPALVEEHYNLPLTTGFADDPKAVQRHLATNLALYKILFSQVDSFMGGGIQRLIVVRHGQLNLVSFDLLLRAKPLGSPYFSKLDYLVRHYAISYASSPSILADALEGANALGGRDYDFVVLAPSYSGLDSLPDEVGPASAMFDAGKRVVMEGMEATEGGFSDFFDAQRKSSKVLHISAHGQVEDSFPAFSRLTLGYPQHYDSLEVGELYGMTIRADLAVLSACNSGFGQFSGGEGTICIARGFSYAGCPAIIMGQWDLPKHANAEIVDSFYQYLVADHLPPDVALQKAKLKFLDDKNKSNFEKAPAFWAGLAPTGLMRRLF